MSITFSDLSKESNELCDKINNLGNDIKEISNKLFKIKYDPTENEAIELYKNFEKSRYAIEKIHDYHRKLNSIITTLRDCYCDHDRIVDNDNFDIAHTCYVCSKCGMIM